MKTALAILFTLLTSIGVSAMDDLSPMQKHKQVDVISLAADGKTVVLSMVETRPWDAEGENLLDLQAKFNAYLDFIESGELVKKHPEAKGKKIVFRLQSQFKPSPQAAQFIELVKKSYLVPASIGLEISELK